jgi:hypothetical protein
MEMIFFIIQPPVFTPLEALVPAIPVRLSRMTE